MAMRVALAAHDEVLRAAIEAHGGWLFKHTGDGVCAAFSSPRCSCRGCGRRAAVVGVAGTDGVATGEAELRVGDYFGAVLNRAARVMAAGHGGQVLLAESTASLLSGVDLLDLGQRRLRDVPMPVGLFQLRAAGLRTEFPPLRALDASPGNLRPATTSWIGRESEVAEIEAAVRSHRLVTLDRGGWGRQDAPCGGSRGAPCRRVPRRGLGFRAGSGHRSGGGARCGGGGAGHHAAAR